VGDVGERDAGHRHVAAVRVSERMARRVLDTDPDAQLLHGPNDVLDPRLADFIGEAKAAVRAGAKGKKHLSKEWLEGDIALPPIHRRHGRRSVGGARLGILDTHF
jgi:hypothetical protein